MAENLRVAFCPVGQHWPAELLGVPLLGLSDDLPPREIWASARLVWNSAGRPTDRWENGDRAAHPDIAELAEPRESLICREHGCAVEWKTKKDRAEDVIARHAFPELQHGFTKINQGRFRKIFGRDLGEFWDWSGFDVCKFGDWLQPRENENESHHDAVIRLYGDAAADFICSLF